MATWKRTLEKVLSGSADAAVRFNDLRKLLERFGFSERIKGDHHIFVRDGIDEILNLQPKGNQAKPYQVRQVRDVLVSYGIVSPEQSADDVETEGDSDEQSSSL